MVARDRYVPIMVNITWPVLRLAASRKDNVKGRTKILTHSIIRSAGFNQPGAPLGSRAPRNLERLLTAEDKIDSVQQGSARERVVNI